MTCAVSFADRLATAMSDAGSPLCACLINPAGYEAGGLPGRRALAAMVAGIRAAAPRAIIIGDVKRGDIGDTARAYATAMFDVWGFDAVTVNPWGGMDTVAPWLERAERGAFIWCRGANAGAGDFQDLIVADDGEPVYLRVARRAQEYAARHCARNLGLMISAADPDVVAALRQAAPELPLLCNPQLSFGPDASNSSGCYALLAPSLGAS